MGGDARAARLCAFLLVPHAVDVGAGAQGMFWAFCAVMGLSMASIFLVFTGTSIARTFFIAAAMFGATSLYGYTTKRDLSQFGSFLIMGLIGVVIASLVTSSLRRARSSL